VIKVAEQSQSTGTNGRVTDQLPMDRLRSELQDLLKALARSAMSSATSRIGTVAGKLPGLAQEAGKSLVGAGGGAGGVAGAITKKVAGAGVEGVKEKVKDAFGGGGSGKAGKQGKVTNMVEAIDVGVPVTVAYNQWTQFTDFPAFMKKVENVQQQSDTELTWRVKILWSHRDWKTTIIEQVPDERIVWRSEGAKGHVDGAVTFHGITPTLTRILMVLEYYPQGLFEKVGNLWRAQGRRARLELKHFQRHVMTEVALHPDEVEGWRGEIHDGEVAEEQPPAGEQSPAEEEPPAGEEAEPRREESGQPQESDQRSRRRPRESGSPDRPKGRSDQPERRRRRTDQDQPASDRRGRGR
jgi:uncharacterized membrane protein